MFATSAFSELPLSTLSGSLFGSSVAEVVTLNEQLDNLASLNSLVTEGASTFGGYYLVGETFHTVVEQASVSQLRQLGGGFSVGSISSGPFSGLGDEPVVVSGDLFIANTTVCSSTTDSASISARIFTTAQMSNFSVVEAALMVDIPIGNIEFTRTFSDAATQTDFILGNPAFSSSVIEAAKATIVRGVGGGFSTGSISSGPFSGLGDLEREVSSDIISAQPEYSVSFTDASSMVGVILSLTTVISTVQDSAAIQGVVPTNIIGNSTVINSASYTDFITSSVVFQTNVVTAAHTLDQISVRLQWEPVPTDAPTNWTLINTLS